MPGLCLSGCFVVLRRHVSCGVMPGMNGLFSGVNGACFYRWGFSVLCFMPFWAVVRSSGFPCFCSSVVPAFVVFIDAGICPDDWRATGIGQSG